MVIKMPHDGYSVEYLQAVVKSAKRPLQRDLDITPIVRGWSLGVKKVYHYKPKH